MSCLGYEYMRLRWLYFYYYFSIYDGEFLSISDDDELLWVGDIPFLARWIPMSISSSSSLELWSELDFLRFFNI